MTDYRTILIRYGCAVAFLLCLSFNTYWFSTSGDGDAEHLVDTIANIQHGLKKMATKPGTVPPVKGNVIYEQVSKNWNVNTSASPAPSYEYIYPSANVTIVKVEEQYKLATPRQFRAQIVKKDILLRWNAPQLENSDEFNMQYDGYELIKEWKNAQGALQQQTFHFMKDKTAYLDKEIAYRTNYTYKLRTFAYNLKASGGMATTILGKEVIASSFLYSKPLLIMPAYELKLLGASGDFAMIELRKYHEGEYIKTICTIRKGDAIEALRVRVPGSKTYVDFTPGWKLHDVTRSRVLRDAKVFKRGQRGNRMMIEKKVAYYTSAITYLDEEQQQVQAIQSK